MTGPLEPLQAADTLVFTRETIRNIAHKHGYFATFAPRLHSDSCTYSRLSCLPAYSPLIQAAAVLTSTYPSTLPIHSLPRPPAKTPLSPQLSLPLNAPSYKASSPISLPSARSLSPRLPPTPASLTASGQPVPTSSGVPTTARHPFVSVASRPRTISRCAASTRRRTCTLYWLA